jgi:hypothetical protein
MLTKGESVTDKLSRMSEACERIIGTECGIRACEAVA